MPTIHSGTNAGLSVYVNAISTGLNIPAEQLRERLRKIASRPPSEPLILKEDLTPADVAFIESSY